MWQFGLYPLDDQSTRLVDRDTERLRGRPQVPVRLATQLCDERVDDPALVFIAPVGDGADNGALALEQGRNRLVDRVRREQIGRVDRVLLSDPVAAVLRLVMLGRCPVELEEGDIRGARERDPMAGDLDRADDQLIVGGVRGLEGAHRVLSSPVAVLAEHTERAREPFEHRALDLAVVGEHDQSLAG